jgi:hypothetical protein
MKTLEEQYCRRDRLMDETFQSIILNVGRGSDDEASDDSTVITTCSENSESATDTASEEFGS